MTTPTPTIMDKTKDKTPEKTLVRHIYHRCQYELEPRTSFCGIVLRNTGVLGVVSESPDICVVCLELSEKLCPICKIPDEP